MKKSLFLICCLLLVCNLRAQNYDKMWKEVETYQSKDLPVSEKEVVRQIYAKAKLKADFCQQVKALATLYKIHCNISPDSTQADVALMEDLLNNPLTTSSPTNMAIMHAILGKTYANQANIHYRDNETSTEDRKKSNTHWDATLVDFETLAGTSSKHYKPLMQIFEQDSRLYNNDMLSVLSDFVILQARFDSQKRYQLYNSIANFYTNKGNRNAALLMRLFALREQTRLWNTPKQLSHQAYKDTLLCIARQNKDIETGADAYLALWGATDKADKNFANALSILDEALTAYPNSIHTNTLKEKRTYFLRPRLTATAYQHTGSPLEINIHYYNVPDCRITFFHKNENRIELSKQLTLPATTHPDNFKESFILPPGDYKMTVECDTLSDTTNVHITTLMAMGTPLPKKQILVTVVDGQTGAPVDYADNDISIIAKYPRSKDAKSEQYTADAKGQAIINSKVYNMELAIDAGNNNTTSLSVWNYSYNNTYHNDTFIRFFTDRCIYRPGQTIQGTILYYTKDKDNAEVRKNSPLTIILKDTNYKEIDTVKVTTNDFGTAAFEFLLPESAEPGRYQIICKENDESTVIVQVEEYKRPTFFVETEVTAERYTLGDTVVIAGQAQTFSGIPVQNAHIAYQIHCRNSLFFYHPAGIWDEVKSDTLTTDNNGRFELPVALSATDFEHNSRMLEYRLTATVTNNTGETQQGSSTLRITKNSFALIGEVPEIIEVGKHNTLSVKAINANGKEVSINGEYIISQILDAEKRNEIFRDTFISNQNIDTKRIEALTPGSYEIEFRAIDTHKDFRHFTDVSDTITAKNQFILFSPTAKSMDVRTDFIHLSAEEFSPSTPVDLYYKAAHNDITLYWLLLSGDSILEQGMKKVGNEMQHVHFDYKDEYGDGLVITFFYVKDFKVYQVSKQIPLAQPDKELTLKWRTFRDHLTLGQKEEWILSITDSKGKPVTAELLANMYDTSLDQIVKHDWRFSLHFLRNIPRVYLQTSATQRYANNIHLNFQTPHYATTGRQFDQLDIPGTRLHILNEVAVSAAPQLKLISKGSGSADLQGRIGGLDLSSTTAYAATADIVEEEAVEEGNLEKATQNIRTNFSETAFFMPHILTNRQGEASISFTLLESTTEWRFMGFAHTADMKHGSISDKVIAAKEFMVVPNMPRFVRVGDKSAISTSIINQTDSTVSGHVCITFINPETDKVISKETQPFTVDSKQSTTATFCFTPHDSLLTSNSSLICQIEAAGENFSDGERHYLPVLSDKQLITRTIPFFMDGKGEKDIDISKIFNNGSTTATNKSLSVEYSGNPAWAVVEALQSITLPDNDNAISLSASFFAQKSLEALSLTADSSLLTNPSSLTSTIQRLTDLQDENGAWSWFEGMSGSRYITITVVEHIAELERLTGKHSELHNAMMKGMEWLDQEELKIYNKRKEDKTNLTPYESTLRYLYVSSLIPRTLPTDIQSMQSAYLTEAEQMIGSLSIYGRANIACALAASGRKTAAHNFVQSLREYTVSQPELGRYYDSPKALYSWYDYRMPTHLAAMKAMRLTEAEFNDTRTYLNEMALWIIQQKRVQAWDNPINTIGAAKTLLDNGEKFNSEESVVRSDKLSVSHTSLNTPHYSPLTNHSSLLTNGNLLTIKKQNEGIAWGAVYGECMENIADIQSAANKEIQISQTIQVQRIVNGKSVWQDLNNTTLRVGDKIRIRYTLTTDRDMDFVRVTGTHAACLESTEQTSGYKWLGTTGAYVSHHDSSCDFFFDRLRKGTLTLDRTMYVVRPGTYTMGIATAQCTYATAFSAHSGSITLVVE